MPMTPPTPLLFGQPLSINLEHHNIGDKAHKHNISALAYDKQHVILAADEGATLWVAKLSGEKTLTLLPHTLQLADESQELDIEALHFFNSQLIVLGSHSLKRKKIKPQLSYKENRKRILDVVEDKYRQQIWVINLPWFSEANSAQHPFDNYKVVHKKSLYKSLKKDELLARFMNIPSKENGIDMEGVAADADSIYIGFRSPVLRQNFVPIWVMKHSHYQDYELRFINCNGQGVRDLLCVQQGMLVLCGPSNSSKGDYTIYFWNKQDTIPGKDKAIQGLTPLGHITPPDHGKAEALTLLKETSSHYHLMVAFDGPEYGHPSCFTLPKHPS